VSRGHGAYRARESEEILFLSPDALENLVDSVAGEKERKLPDVVLKYTQLEKKEFVRDWMRGFINLERDQDDEYFFSIDRERCVDKDIFVEYLGTFDGMGSFVGESKSTAGSRKCRDDHVVEASPSTAAMSVVV